MARKVCAFDMVPTVEKQKHFFVVVPSVQKMLKYCLESVVNVLLVGRSCRAKDKQGLTNV